MLHIICIRLIVVGIFLQLFLGFLQKQESHVTAYRQNYRNPESNENLGEIRTMSPARGRNQYEYNPRQEFSQQHALNRQYQQPMQQSQINGNRLSPSTATNYELNQGQSDEESLQLLQRQRRLKLKLKNLSHESVVDRNRNKCRIWVPTETVDKYTLAVRIQMDQINQQSLIEICCTGYAAVKWLGNTHCRPICENCVNGYCRAPEECECYEEFVKNENGDCVFTCPLGCLNGRCYLDGSCECEPGYKLDETRKFCRPICSGGCGINPRHNCTEPEVCSCAKGYQLTDEGCQPVCNPACGIGGICHENNECDCGPGYNIKNGVCQSDCYQKCDNGVCVSPNRCICNSGFSYHERSTQCVPV